MTFLWKPREVGFKVCSTRWSSCLVVSRAKNLRLTGSSALGENLQPLFCYGLSVSQHPPFLSAHPQIDGSLHPRQRSMSINAPSWDHCGAGDFRTVRAKRPWMSAVKQGCPTAWMKSVAVTACPRPLQAPAPQNPSVGGRGTHAVSLLAEDLLKSLTTGGRKVRGCPCPSRLVHTCSHRGNAK